MQKRSIVVLSLTVIFNLLFWLMIANHYSLLGTLIGLPTTVFVGSAAAVYFSSLLVSTRQLTFPTLKAIKSTQEARFFLLFLPLWGWAATVLPVALFLFGFAFIFLFIMLALYNVQPSIDWFSISLAVGSLLAILASYIALIVFFSGVASVVKRAALSKPVALVGYSLQAVSLTLVLAFLLSNLQGSDVDQPLCSKRLASPSGQKAIVIRDQWDSFWGDAEVSHAYFEGAILRKDLGDFGDGYVCRQEPLTLKWSADERLVEWKTPYHQGNWRF